MDNFHSSHFPYCDKAGENESLDYMLLQQDPFNMSQNMVDFGNAMFSSIGMKGNIHSALFNSIPKQLSFSNEPFSVEAKPKINNTSHPYVGFRPQAPAEFANPYSTHSIYSSTGFDLLRILSYLVSRPNPTINIGPVDLSCAFLLVDACKQDFPIVYSSPAFQTLTGYDTHEVVGRNCRFLQSPDGNVSSGSRRKYVDNQQIFTIKNQLLNAKETQTSLVNYRKNGQPFINLLTMIPIYENGAVVYFVGLQVDMVEQPNAIIENMSGGRYALNYGVPTFTKLVEPDHDDELKELFGSNMKPPKLDDLETYSQAENEWTRMLLENTSDFLHVISLKGSFLYASPNSKALFGHNPSDLEGVSLEKFCHPGDLMSVLRDLREAASLESPVSLVYRFKIADGGYVWMESTGKINSDLGKGRRCVIMTGRVRPAYQLTRELMFSCGGETSSNEYWSKISTDGLILHATPTCFNVLGYLPEELNGTSLYQFMHPNSIMSLTTSLDKASSGDVSQFSHQFQSKKGLFLDVNTIIYPGSYSTPSSQKPAFFICRSKLVSLSVSESKEIVNKINGDLFDVLSPNCSTSWQFELQQLRLKNRKLREELDSHAPKNHNKRRVSKLNRQCLACKRTSTAEWRRGPEGPSTLCNPCGLKYAKGISPYDSFGSALTSSATGPSGSGFFSSSSNSQTPKLSSLDSSDSLLTPPDCQSPVEMNFRGSK